MTPGPNIQLLDNDSKDDGSSSSLPFNEKIPFETDAFQGTFYVRFADISPSDPAKSAAHAAYFADKKRFYQMVVQGRFTDPSLTFADLLLGDVYDRPIQGVPKGRLFQLLQKFMEALAPGIIFEMTDDRPRVLVPIGGAQTLRVDLPGEEPSDYSKLEDSTALLVGGGFGSTKERRKKLSVPKTAREYKVSVDHVYTFECYDHSMDFANYEQVFMLGKRIDLVEKLDGQVMSLGMYKRDDKSSCIYKFPFWHERMMKTPEK